MASGILICSASEYLPAVSATVRKFAPSAPQGLLIVGPAEDHVLRVVIDPRELPQEVADVGADPEVVELSGVDADAHGSNDIWSFGHLVIWPLLLNGNIGQRRTNDQMTK